MNPSSEAYFVLPYVCAADWELGLTMSHYEKKALSPYLKRRLRSLEEAEDDVRRSRDRAHIIELERLAQRPSAEIIPFPQR